MPSFRSPKLEPPLAALLGRHRVLARASGPTGTVAGTAEALYHPDGGSWRRQPWQLIEHGRWDAEASVLSWTDLDGVDHRQELTAPGRLPDLFQERITATIAVARTVEAGRGRSAVISARRDLADPSAPLVWRVAPGPGLARDGLLDDPLIRLQLEQLRSEYDHP